MFCQNCGAQLAESSSFCSNCGKSSTITETAMPVFEIVKPEKVILATKLLYSTLVIGLVNLCWNFNNYMAMGISLRFTLFVSIGTFALLGFFIYKISMGRNWARIVFLVLFILGILFSISTLLQTLVSITGLLQLLQTIMQIVALVFLFSSESNEWFKQQKS